MTWQGAVDFYHQLRVLMGTGMTMPQALPLAAGGAREPYRSWVPGWAEGTARGQALADCMEASGERPLAVALIRAGERSGRLAELCDEIVGFYQQCLDLRRLVIQRTWYPAILIHAVLFFPALPPVVLGQAHPLTLLAGPALLWAVVLGLVVAGRGLGLTNLPSRLALWGPLGLVTRQLVAANTCLVTAAGLGAGMLLEEALRLAAPTCGNAIVGRRLAEMADRVGREEVREVVPALAAAGIDRDLLQLVVTGVEAGRVPEELERAAAIARERFRSRLDGAARLVMAVVYLAALVTAAITIISMFMRLYAPVFEGLE